MNSSSSGRSEDPHLYSHDDAISRGHPALAVVSNRCSSLEGRLSMHYSPLCRSTRNRSYFRARLACLIHAASVRSEPGSNPSFEFFLLTVRPRKRMNQSQFIWVADRPFGFPRRAGRTHFALFPPPLGPIQKEKAELRRALRELTYFSQAPVFKVRPAGSTPPAVALLGHSAIRVSRRAESRGLWVP